MQHSIYEQQKSFPWSEISEVIGMHSDENWVLQIYYVIYYIDTWYENIVLRYA